MRARGFTLIEVLIVMALSFIGLFGLMSMQVVAVRANGFGRGMTEAVSLAQHRMETLERLPLAVVAGLTESGLGPLGTPVQGGVYSRVTTVTPVAAGTQIRVQVSYLDAGGRVRTVSLQTVRAP